MWAIARKLTQEIIEFDLGSVLRAEPWRGGMHLAGHSAGS
jgi:hypothetical protein